MTFPFDCSDGADENKCTSGCGGNSWLIGDSGTVTVSNYVKSCTWILHAEPDQLGVIRVEKLLADVPFKIMKYDSIEKKWITHNKLIHHISGEVGASLTLRIDLETTDDTNGLLDLSLKYRHEKLGPNNEISCDRQYRCANKMKCISTEMVCNGVADCPSGDDENNCNKSECGSGRYLTATNTEQVLLSQNFPNPWFGKYFRLNFDQEFKMFLGRGECKYTISSTRGRIKLSFVEFNSNLEDEIEIYDGTGCQKRLIKTHSGTEAFSIVSTSNVIHVETFNTDFIHMRRFKIFYHIFEPS